VNAKGGRIRWRISAGKRKAKGGHNDTGGERKRGEVSTHFIYLMRSGVWRDIIRDVKDKDERPRPRVITPTKRRSKGEETKGDRYSVVGYQTKGEDARGGEFVGGDTEDF